MAKKKKCECKPGLPGWLATYGDMMSLLLTFFILLVSFSSIQESKFKSAAGSLEGSLGVLESEKTVPINKELLMAIPSSVENDEMIEEMDLLEQAIKAAAQELGLESEITVENLGEAIKVKIADPVFFDLGKADLKPLAKDILNKILLIIKDKTLDIRIEGHTDDLPIKTAEFPSNWELSSKRAINVLKYLADVGKLDPKNLSAIGYAEYRPLVPNINEENRKKNRRVEIYMKPLPGSTIKNISSISDSVKIVDSIRVVR